MNLSDNQKRQIVQQAVAQLRKMPEESLDEGKKQLRHKLFRN